MQRTNVFFALCALLGDGILLLVTRRPRASLHRCPFFHRGVRRRSSSESSTSADKRLNARPTAVLLAYSKRRRQMRRLVLVLALVLGSTAVLPGSVGADIGGLTQ